MEDAKLWTPETPYLYTARIKYLQNGQLLDATTQKFGIRTVKVSKDGGFQLNGMTRKIKGVCLHHDLGPLGVAVNKAALIRQIKTMKEMGCDAIRTSHNMPSQMQMDICDSLGMMVMAESFDMWNYPKCKNGYARFFEEWCYRDIENLVLANRNHPSIIMWSIGNEIPEQGSEEGAEISEYLQDLCHSFDPTRPVTQGLDHAEKSIESGVAKLMDVPGFNYRVHKYQNSIKQLPQGFLLGSETASTVSSRGVYKYPVEPDDNARYASWAEGYDPKAIEKADGQCSSYDVEYCPWSNLPDDDWAMQDDYPWVIGEFVWTGYDYLGEPSPYDEYWPSRSSYFGICDLAGLPKDRYYLYRSHWNQRKHTIHLLPHWSFGRERIGKVTPVYCYTDYPTAELFVNGKSQGKISKNAASRLDRYRLRWNNVKYHPGVIKVVVYDADGNYAGEKSIRTAGKPAKLQLNAWTQHDAPKLNADGNDLAFVTVSLTDAKGTVIPLVEEETCLLAFGPVDIELVGILQHHLFVIRESGSLVQITIHQFQSGLERCSSGTLVIYCLQGIPIYLLQSIADSALCPEHTHRMGLKHANPVVIVDDKAWQAVAFSVDEAIAIGRSSPTCQAGGNPHVQRPGDHIHPIVRTENVLAGETEDTHGDGADLVVSVCQELAFLGEHTHDVTFGRFPDYLRNRAGEHPRMESAQGFIPASFQDYLCHQSRFSEGLEASVPESGDSSRTKAA